MSAGAPGENKAATYVGIREKRTRLEAHGSAWSSKLMTLADVVRSEGRGKKVRAIRQPSLVSCAPRGESHEQYQATSAAALGAISALSIPSSGQAPADAVSVGRSDPEPGPATDK